MTTRYKALPSPLTIPKAKVRASGLLHFNVHLAVLGYRLKAKYCWHMAAAFGNDRLTSGEAANLRRSSLVPPLLSKSMWPHDIARSLAGPVSRPMSFKAQHLLFEIAVLRTYQQTSRVYRRHPLAAPSHIGTWCDSFSIVPQVGTKTNV